MVMIEVSPQQPNTHHSHERLPFFGSSLFSGGRYLPSIIEGINPHI
jgi:hypothetical protein